MISVTVTSRGSAGPTGGRISQASRAFAQPILSKTARSAVASLRISVCWEMRTAETEIESHQARCLLRWLKFLASFKASLEPVPRG